MSTASRPPNDRCRPVATSTGSGLWTPGSGATPAMRLSPFIDEYLLPVPEDALGAEDHEQHHPDTDEHQFDLSGGGRRQEIRDPGDVGLSIDHEGVDREEHELEGDSTDDRSENRPCTAEDDDDVEDERDLRQIGIGCHVLLLDGEEDACDACDRTADHQRLELVCDDVLAYTHLRAHETVLDLV